MTQANTRSGSGFHLPGKSVILLTIALYYFIRSSSQRGVIMFEKIQAAPADPILGLGEAFKAEQREGKVNLGIGVYKDAAGQTPIVKAVKEAEKRLLDKENTKSYPHHRRRSRFQCRNPKAAVWRESEIVQSRRAKTAQSLGGTGCIARGCRIHQTPNACPKCVD